MGMPMQDEIRSFEDILRLLTERPGLREQLRQLLLTQELLELPKEVGRLTEGISRLERQVERLVQAQERTEAQLQQLAEAQARTEERVGALEEAVVRLAEAQARAEERLGRLEERVGALEERADRLEQAVVRLAEAQERTERELRSLAATVTSLVGEVGDLQGWRLEEDVRRRPLRHLRRFVLAPRVLDEQQVLALAAGLPDDEVDSLLDADLIAQGERNGQPVYVVAEVSRTARVYDVDRAAGRAELLRRVVKEPVLAAVIGDRARPAAVRRARERQVWQIIGRRAWAPGERLPDDLVADGPDGDLPL
jgi:predicted  nucleic acid-binding Zn-ribbon protein